MVGGVQSTSETGTGAGDFTPRLVDQFFRRWFWYALPVVLLMAVGVRASQNVQEPFISSGTLSASENPLRRDAGSSRDLDRSVRAASERIRAPHQ